MTIRGLLTTRIRNTDLVQGKLTQAKAREILNRRDICRGLGLPQVPFSKNIFKPDYGYAAYYQMRAEDQGRDAMELTRLFDMRRHPAEIVGDEIPLGEIIRVADLDAFPLGIIKEVRVGEKIFEILIPTTEGLRANGIDLDKIFEKGYSTKEYLLVGVYEEGQLRLLEEINKRLPPDQEFGFLNYLATLKVLGVEGNLYSFRNSQGKKTGITLYEGGLYDYLTKKGINLLDIAEERKAYERGIFYDPPGIVTLEQFRRNPKLDTIRLIDPDSLLDIDESLRPADHTGILFGRLKT